MMEAMSKGLGPSGPEPSYSRANDDSNSKSRRTRFESAADPTHLRKGNPCRLDGLGDVVPMYAGWRQPFMYFDWFWRPWVYLDSPVYFVAWYSCAGFFFGALFFVVGSFASIAPKIYNSAVAGNCMRDSYDWSVTFTFLVGNVLWQPAVIMQVMEAQNHDWEAKYEDWYLGGKLGKPPRYRYFACYYWSLEWWGGMCYTIGVVGYNLAAITAVVYDCDVFNTDTYVGLTTYVYMGAGILFLIAGVLYSMVYINIWLVPAILVPYRKRDATSMMWWALWLYFWGGVGFCMVGIFYYWDSYINDVASFKSYQIIQGIGFGGGSLFFNWGAGLLLARQSRGRCRPSYQQVHQRYDRTERADPQRTAAKHLPEGFTKVSVDYPGSNGAYGEPVGRDLHNEDSAHGINGHAGNGHAQV